MLLDVELEGGTRRKTTLSAERDQRGTTGQRPRLELWDDQIVGTELTIEAPFAARLSDGNLALSAFFLAFNLNGRATNFEIR